MKLKLGRALMSTAAALFLVSMATWLFGINGADLAASNAAFALTWPTLLIGMALRGAAELEDR